MNQIHKPPKPRLLSIWAGGAFALFLLLVYCLLTNRLAPFDNWAYNRVSAYIAPGLTKAVVFVTDLGDDRALITGAVLAFLLLLRRQGWLLASIAAANLPLASLVNTTLKHLFVRPRPSVPRLVEIGGYSFPSGHSFVSMSFYGLLIVLALRLLPPRARWWACLPLGGLIAAIGLSRVYLGVHYASDVLAGLCGGFLWLTAYRRAAKRVWPRLPL